MTGYYIHWPATEPPLKCPFIDCAWGMGLAGRGVCNARGLWWTSHYPAYQTEEEFEEEWRNREDEVNWKMIKKEKQWK